MKQENITLLINVAFSLVELIVRLQKENPDFYADHEEKIKILKNKLEELNKEPSDYLQKWPES